MPWSLFPNRVQSVLLLVTLLLCQALIAAPLSAQDSLADDAAALAIS